MSCEDCEKSQEARELTSYVRIGTGNVEITGCREHLQILIEGYQAGERVAQALAQVRKRMEPWRAALARVGTLNQLAVLLGGSEDSFTGEILRACAHADPGNLARLRAVYPELVLGWQAWRDCDPAPSVDELWARIAELARDEL